MFLLLAKRYYENKDVISTHNKNTTFCVEYDYLVGYIRDSLLTKQIIKLKNYEERSYSEEGSS